MSLILCKKHGEVGLILTVSAMLSHGIKQETVSADDIGITHIKLIDKGELLSETIYFFHNKFDNLKPFYLIDDDKSDQQFSQEISQIFNGGGYCVYCFKDYMEKIKFDLNNLPAPSGLTI